MPAKVSSEVGLALRVRGGCKGIRRTSPAPERQSIHLTRAAYRDLFDGSCMGEWNASRCCASGHLSCRHSSRYFGSGMILGGCRGISQMCEKRTRRAVGKAECADRKAPPGAFSL
jgi:hypothetical protein